MVTTSLDWIRAQDFGCLNPSFAREVREFGLIAPPAPLIFPGLDGVR